MNTKDTNEYRFGTLLLTLTLGSGMFYCLWAGLRHGVLLFGMGWGCQIAQWLVGKITLPKRLATPLAFFLAAAARAALPAIIAIAAGVAIMGFVGVKLWSKAMSVQLQNAAKPIHVAEVAPPSAARAAAAMTAPAMLAVFTEDAVFAAAGAERAPETPALRYAVPRGYNVEHSTNLVDWEIFLPYEEESREVDLYNTQQQEYFRLVHKSNYH